MDDRFKKMKHGFKDQEFTVAIDKTKRLFTVASKASFSFKKKKNIFSIFFLFVSSFFGLSCELTKRLTLIKK